MTEHPDSFKSATDLVVDGKTYRIFSLARAAANGLSGIEQLPTSMKVLLENLLRFEDGQSVRADDIVAMKDWLLARTSQREIAFRPARVLMQDFTGVPAVVDLAAMRDAMAAMGGDPAKINPLVPVDLVIDHSVMVDAFGTEAAFGQNVAREYERNEERYRFLRWGAGAFDNFRVVPPGTGICHQVNLEFLAQGVWTREAGGVTEAYPDTLVGTDSHTTMVNGLAVLGWGVGGIEAEAAMLGQPISMLIPEVVGMRLSGRLREGVTATDLVLTVTQMLRKAGVVGKFVEFYGPGLSGMPLEDRATIANMAPEYGATCGFFPVDGETTAYLRATARDDHRTALVEAYAREQGLWRTDDAAEPVFTQTLSLDLASVEPSLAGPRRPQDRVALGDAPVSFFNALAEIRGFRPGSEAAAMLSEGGGALPDYEKHGPVANAGYELHDGHVVIAAITSCTNTSNPSVLIAAGLLAKKASALGLETKPWVKTSLAPGSQVVTDYLERAGLTPHLNALGFDLVGYGCTTCIGNSGPLPEPISAAVNEHDLVVAAVLSGNRNFEGRVNPDVRANYLASPPLVVAYALAGTMKLNLATEPLGRDDRGRLVYLRDIWPSNAEVADCVRRVVTAQMYRERYADVFAGDAQWQALGGANTALTYDWDNTSTYVQNPPYFDALSAQPAPVGDIVDARVLGLFLDSITTDHISPAGPIAKAGPAGRYLIDHGVAPVEFNSYGARRGNHEVMMRGTFANIRIKNQMLPGTEGGMTIHVPTGEKLSIYEAAMRYRAESTPLVVFAGREYGTGSSRDWAAKGTRLLGVRAVIAQSFERIHRSNLIGMGVLPLVMQNELSWRDLGLTGMETVVIRGLDRLTPQAVLAVEITGADGVVRSMPALSRIDTLDELAYFRNGGILPFVLRSLAAA